MQKIKDKPLKTCLEGTGETPLIEHVPSKRGTVAWPRTAVLGDALDVVRGSSLRVTVKKYDNDPFTNFNVTDADVV